MPKVLVEFDVLDAGAFEEQLKAWSETKAGDAIHGFRTDAGGHGLRPALYDFAVEMERKLRKNDHKKGWRTYALEALRRLLAIECSELDVAMDFKIGDAKTECVDIANFAMMLYDRLGNPPKTEPADHSEAILAADLKLNGPAHSVPSAFKATPLDPAGDGPRFPHSEGGA